MLPRVSEHALLLAAQVLRLLQDKMGHLDHRNPSFGLDTGRTCRPIWRSYRVHGPNASYENEIRSVDGRIRPETKVIHASSKKRQSGCLPQEEESGWVPETTGCRTER